MKIDTLHSATWNEYTLGQLFTFKKGKRLRKEDMLEGTTNYLGAISENNGIRQKIDNSPLFEPNCLTINYNGSVGETFYQDTPFWASDDVNVLYAKGWKLNEYIGIFIATVIKANKYRFSYGRKWTLEKMKASIVSLPSKKDGLPDFDFMERYIKSLRYKPIKTTVKREMLSPPKTEKWGEFMTGDLFAVKRGKRIVREQDYFLQKTSEYCYNVITSTKQNNGVDGYYHSFNCTANSIVCGGEAGGMFTTYQPSNCWVMDRARVFTPKQGVVINKYIALFLTTIFSQNQYKYSYGRTPNPDGIENTLIKLPITNQGSPDWAYMERYIKSLPYGDII